MVISINPAPLLLRVAANALAGDLASRRGAGDEAVHALRLAVAQEDSLHYDEPPTWYWPVRHTLGAALLRAGRAPEAEAVYREDLRRNLRKANIPHRLPPGRTINSGDIVKVAVGPVKRMTDCRPTRTEVTNHQR